MTDDKGAGRKVVSSLTAGQSFALRVTLSYAVVGSIWVLAFDILLPLYYQDSTIVAYSGFLEGFVYVSTTSWLLYKMTRTHLASLRAFTELVQSKEHYLAKVLETLPVGIWLLDPEGKITLTNPAAREIRSSTASSLAMSAATEAKRPDPVAALSTALTTESALVLQGSEPVLNEVIDISSDRDDLKVILHSAVPLRDENDKIIGTVVVNQDITEAKRIERELLENQRQLTSLAAELSMAEERERRRIATELHDQIGQTLALCKIRLEQIDASDTANLSRVRELLNTTIHKVRTLTFEVSPPLLYQVGLEAALEWLGERYHEEHGLFFRMHLPHKLRPLPEELRVTLFQIVRELLVNITKHAGATSVVIAMEEADGEIQVQVTDDGIGFPTVSGVAKKAVHEGFGLFNAQRRIEHLGGSMLINSTQGRGTTVILRLPLTAQPEGAD